MPTKLVPHLEVNVNQLFGVSKMNGKANVYEKRRPSQTNQWNRLVEISQEIRVSDPLKPSANPRQSSYMFV